MTKSYILLISIISLIFQFFIPTQSFSSWFISPRSCWVDLRDTEEIIMNNEITPVTESIHGDDVNIEVFQRSKDGLQLNPVEVLVVDIGRDLGKKRIVYLDNDVTQGEVCPSGNGSNDEEDMSFDYVLKLKINEDAKLFDLQYVMDAKIFPENDEEKDVDSNRNERHQDILMKAEFIERSGCNGMRGYGKKGDDGLALQIKMPSSYFAFSNIHEHGVEIIAGWACGHETVTLTNAIEFRPRKSDICSSSLD